MAQVIRLKSEVLLDSSTIKDPYLRLLAAAIGRKLIRGSPWLAIDRAVAASWAIPGNSSSQQCSGLHTSNSHEEGDSTLIINAQ